MLDFNSRSALSDRMNFLIDESFTQESQKRDYLGASIIGHACERHVQYQWLAVLGQVARKEFSPRILRIFDRGNLYEERARAWLKQAGFLFGRTKKGKAFTDFNGEFKGHVDGVITGWKPRDVPCPVELPLLWEHKCLGAKNWKKVSTDRLKDYSSTYYVQCQIYMHYLGLERCLFMATNADTMEIYHEIVPYNEHEAQSARDRVARVLLATAEPCEMLPRMTQDKNYYICKWCDFHGGCWS